jgi:hypothetical protein
MKKIVILAAFLCNVLTISAQDDIRFGFQLSPSFSWMSTDNNKINPSGTNLGLKLGMIGEYLIGENYAFSTGLGFAFNSGGTLLHDYGGQYWTKSDLPSTLDSLSNGSKLKYGVQYLEIPIGLKMRTNEFGYIRYFLEPGISIGIKTQARGVINDPGQSGENEEKFNITKEVNGIYMSWGVGGGIEYSLSTSTSLIAGLGFQIGFTDVSDDNGTVFDPRGNRSEDAKAIINAITIKLGILF